MTERTGPNLCEDEGCEEQPLVHSHPPEFDAHAAICKLVEWKCPGCSMCNPRNIRGQQKEAS